MTVIAKKDGDGKDEKLKPACNDEKKETPACESPRIACEIKIRKKKRSSFLCCGVPDRAEISGADSVANTAPAKLERYSSFATGTTMASLPQPQLSPSFSSATFDSTSSTKSLAAPTLWNKKMRVAVGSLRMMIRTMSVNGLTKQVVRRMIPAVPKRMLKRNGEMKHSQFRVNPNFTAEWIWPASLIPDCATLDYQQKNPVHETEPFLTHIRNHTIVLYIHGGGYVTCTKGTHRIITFNCSGQANVVVLSVNYRRIPKTDIVGVQDDVQSSFDFLTQLNHVPASNIILSGDSAGSALCLSLMLRLRDSGRALPRAASIISPWVDLDLSVHREPIPMARYDYFKTSLKVYQQITKLVVGSLDPRDPVVSPIYADLTGLPPLFIQYGEYESLRPQIEDFVKRAKAASPGLVFSDMIPQMPHVPHQFATLNQAANGAFEKMALFINDPEGMRANNWQKLNFVSQWSSELLDDEDDDDFLSDQSICDDEEDQYLSSSVDSPKSSCTNGEDDMAPSPKSSCTNKEDDIAPSVTSSPSFLEQPDIEYSITITMEDSSVVSPKE